MATNTDIQIITPEEPSFPSAFSSIAIKALYQRGLMPKPSRPHLAVVGTRRCTPEGERLTRDLIKPLAHAGVVIVSGLAEGIDTAAHSAALAANGTTIAVLGTGLDDASLYPQRNASMARNIIKNGGALISEYPPGTPGRKHHFPQRNRIIAALAAVTLVIEAPEKSGALITAEHAKRLGRTVAAIPGSLAIPQYKGNNRLLEEGAVAVTSAQRLAALLDIILLPQQQLYTPTSSAEYEVLSLLREKPQNVDGILEQCTILPTQLLATLTHLEQSGIIEDIGGKRYTLKVKILNYKS